MRRYPLTIRELTHISLAVSLALFITLSPIECFALCSQVENSATKPQERTELEPNYKVNHCFNMGNEDGYRDHKNNKRRQHDSNCRSSDQAEGYASGYEEGFGGERSYRRDHRLSSWARVRVGHR